MYIKDVNDHTGWIMFIRLYDLENVDDKTGRIVIAVIELMLVKQKWLLCSLYNLSKVKYCEFVTVFGRFVESFLVESCNLIFLADYNLNKLNEKHCLKVCFAVNELFFKVKIPTYIEC